MALSKADPARPMEGMMPTSSRRLANETAVYWADSTGRRNTPEYGGVGMSRPKGWSSTMTGRAPMRSPGRPGVSRDVQRLFWARVAEGLPSEDAAVACGVSPAVGTRWFRENGGVPQINLTVSGRYLSFAERED